MHTHALHTPRLTYVNISRLCLQIAYHLYTYLGAYGINAIHCISRYNTNFITYDEINLNQSVGLIIIWRIQ